MVGLIYMDTGSFHTPAPYGFDMQTGAVIPNPYEPPQLLTQCSNPKNVVICATWLTYAMAEGIGRTARDANALITNDFLNASNGGLGGSFSHLLDFPVPTAGHQSGIFCSHLS